jgi:hypothetical protein
MELEPGPRSLVERGPAALIRDDVDSQIRREGRSVGSFEDTGLPDIASVGGLHSTVRSARYRARRHVHEALIAHARDLGNGKEIQRGNGLVVT